jgi:hypothetical protein
MREDRASRRPDTSSRGLQLPLPGTDLISSAVHKLHNDRAKEEIFRRERGLVEAEVSPIQYSVAARFKEEVLIPRKDLWDATIYQLGNTVPTSVNLTSDYEKYNVTLGWHFQEMLLTEEGDTQVDISLYANHLPIGEKSTAEKPNDLFTAAACLSDEGNTNKPSKYYSNGTVLGIPVEKAQGQQTINSIDLGIKLAEEAAPKIHHLYVNVEAQVLGTGHTTKISEIEIQPRDFAPIGEAKLAERDEYLLHADRLMQHLQYNAHLGSPNPTQEQIEKFLLWKYIEPGIGKEYEALASALVHIDAATPVVKANELVVLDQKPAIVRKLFYRGTS